MTPLSWNADRARLPDGRLRTRIGVKHCNFLRADGWWQAIDARPRQVGNVLQVANAPFKFEAPLRADGEFRFDATVRYDVNRKQTIGSAPVGMTKRFPGVAAVEGIVDRYAIRYPLAAPAVAADIVILLHEQHVQFVYEWQLMPGGAGEFVACPVEFEFDGRPELARKAGSRTIATSDADVGEAITHAASTGRGVTIKPARVWDSIGRSAPVKLRMRRIGNRLVGVKLVPRAFLQAAFADGATWVRSDTTSTFYPDADSESTTVDGTTYNYSWGTYGFYNLVSGAGTGSWDNLSVDYPCGLYANSDTDTWDGVYRAIFLFDTSSLPDADSISAADLILATSTAGPSNDDFASTIAVQPSDPASNTAVTSDDYATMRNDTTKLGELAVSSWSSVNGTPNAIPLNAAGRAAINKTGITKLGTVAEADRTNTDPGWVASGSLTLYCYFADEPGTTNDPKLEVTHAEAPAFSPAWASNSNQVIQ